MLIKAYELISRALVAFIRDQISSVKITYTDGSEYIVFNENTANYGNLVGDDAGYTSVFNRLVDTSNVAKITVNSTEYTAE